MYALQNYSKRIGENPGGMLEVRVSAKEMIVDELYLEGPADVRKAYEWTPEELR